MSNQALALPEEALNQDQSTFLEVAKVGDYLPQIRLVQSSSPLVAKRKASSGDIIIVKSNDNVVHKAEQLIIIPIAYRGLALYTESDPPLAYYDMKSAAFQDIKAKALLYKNDGNLVGPQFLCWVPEQKMFATFFMASKTLKNCASELQGLIPQVVTMKSNLIEKPKYSWFGLLFTPCSVPVDMPDQAALKEEVVKFKNPKSSEIETATNVNERADR